MNDRTHKTVDKSNTVVHFQDKLWQSLLRMSVSLLYTPSLAGLDAESGHDSRAGRSEGPASNGGRDIGRGGSGAVGGGAPAQNKEAESKTDKDKSHVSKLQYFPYTLLSGVSYEPDGKESRAQ